MGKMKLDNGNIYPYLQNIRNGIILQQGYFYPSVYGEVRLAITGYILERKVGEGEWEQLDMVDASVGYLQTPLTLSGELDVDKIIIEGS